MSRRQPICEFAGEEQSGYQKAEEESLCLEKCLGWSGLSSDMLQMVREEKGLNPSAALGVKASGNSLEWKTATMAE